MDKRLLSDTGDEHVKVLLDPSDAVKLVRRVRKVSYFIRINAELVTECDEEAGTYKFFPAGETMKITQRQAIDFLDKMAETAERLLQREKGPMVGRIEVTRLGNCLFIG